MVFVSDFPDVRVGNITLRIVVMEGRGDQNTNRLSNRILNRLSFSTPDGLGIQRVEHEDPVVGKDDSTVKRAGSEHIVAGNDLS